MSTLSDIYNSVKDFYTPKTGEQGLLGSIKTLMQDSNRSTINPYLAAQETMGKITPDQYNQILKNGYVDQWKQEANNRSILGANNTNLSDIYNSYQNQVNNGTATTIPFAIAEEMMNNKVLPTSKSQESTTTVNSSIPDYSEEQKNKAINYFVNNASKVDPNSQYRNTPEKAKENAKYTESYLNELFKQAPQYNLDPMMLTAIAAQESGWGGTRYGNNLLGSGIFENGTNLGRGQNSESISDSVSSLLEGISSDYGGIYQNKTTPQGFVEGKYKWNTHPSWVENVGIIRNSLN